MQQISRMDCYSYWFCYILGLFNVCDKVLISLEIFLEWRQLFRRGVPISIAIQSKLNAMVERVEVECY